MKKILLMIVATGSLLSGLQASAQVLLATTNRGELVEVDLVAGTATLVGDAGRPAGKEFDIGWTGLSFDSAGNLIAVSRQSGEPETGCPGSPANVEVRCAHIYSIDPATGAVIAEIGNTEMPFVSDIDFAAGGALYGSQWDGRGTLASIDPTLGTGTAVGFYGDKMSSTGAVIDIQNGGLAVHPTTGELWAIESNFGTADDGVPAIFKVDATTGAVIPPVVPLGTLGSPLTFGFDALEILPDGRFIASRAGGRDDIFEIDPDPDATSGLAEVTLIAMMLDPAISGSLNGLEFFTMSPSLLESLINDINSLGLDNRTRRRLVRILEDVQKKISRNRLDVARQRMCDFVDELEAAVSGSKIMPVDANPLLAKGGIILGQIAFE